MKDNPIPVNPNPKKVYTVTFDGIKEVFDTMEAALYWCAANCVVARRDGDSVLVQPRNKAFHMRINEENVMTKNDIEIYIN